MVCPQVHSALSPVCLNMITSCWDPTFVCSRFLFYSETVPSCVSSRISIPPVRFHLSVFFRSFPRLSFFPPHFPPVPHPIIGVSVHSLCYPSCLCQFISCCSMLFCGLPSSSVSACICLLLFCLPVLCLFQCLQVSPRWYVLILVSCFSFICTLIFLHFFLSVMFLLCFWSL